MVTKLEELKAAYAKVPKQDWAYDSSCAAVVYVDKYCVRCAADLGRHDSTAQFGEFIALSHNLMPTLLEAVELLEAVGDTCDDAELHNLWEYKIEPLLERLK